MTKPATLRVVDARDQDEVDVPLGALGDRAALERLYRRHLDTCLRTALRLLRNRAEAEDVVQDAFTTAFTRLSQLRKPGAFRAWLLRIVINRTNDQFKGRRVEPIDSLESQAGPNGDPAARTELRLLDRALDVLPIQERNAWVLRYVMGYKLEEVADACACSLATAKRRIGSAASVVDRHVKIGGDHHA